MIGELKFIDYCDFLYEPLPKFCVQRNNHLTAITTNTGVLLMKLHPDLEKAINYVTYWKFFIKPSTYMLIDHLDIDVGLFIFNLPQDSVFLCLLQSNITGSLENLKKTNFFMNKCSLSPNRLIGEECIVATITDVGALDLYVKVCHVTGLTKYEHVLNMNELHIEKFKYRWKDMKEKSTADQHAEALRRISMHSAKVICWTEILQENIPGHSKKSNIQIRQYSCLIAGYDDGCIIFWQLNQTQMENYKEVKASLMFEYQSKLPNLTTMCWHQVNTSSGLLFLGNQHGKTIIVPIFNVLINYCENGEKIILTDTTEITVDHIAVEVKDNFMIVHVIQQSHILFFVLNEDASICQQLDFNCGNLNITGFQRTLGGTILLPTLTGALLEIKTCIKDNKLHVEKRPVFMNLDWSKHTMIDVFLSKNDAILSIVTFHYGYNYKLRLKMKVWNFANKEEQALATFMSLSRISDGLDLLEVMRVRSLQKKEIIGKALPANTDYDNLTLAELKKLLCIAKISELVSEKVETLTKYNVKQATDIITMIYIQLSIYLLQKIVKELKENGAVSAYKREVGHICYTNLKDIVLSDFLKVHKLMKNYVEQIASLLEECASLNLQEDLVCKICEHTYAGLSCPTRHIDNRCSFTMVQILSAKLKCSICGCYVADEAITFAQELSCTLCDSPLDRIIANFKEEPFEFKPLCKEDCLSNIT